ncbi:unnamed protein product [Rotaria socialis]|uniref:Uncharacterized protein n=1 Tax=Rotaria socialis TaxID=392032 RepID=A0A820EXH8_9BILA|nr:unnamed protein product [Rotaria socialis]
MANSLSKKIERIANISLNQIAYEQSTYLHWFALIVYHPFVLEYQSRRINKYLIEHDTQDSNFDEDKSNKCFAELLSSSDRLNSRKCFIDTANENFNYFQDYFCANIYQDAKINLLNNINQDLFIEQLLPCSIVGYEDFIRLDWFRTILGWQHPDYAC